VLAKLRLANVHRFEGQNLQARELVDSIYPHLSKLSEVDSLRAEALKLRLGGNLFKEIDVLKKIYTLFPTRKEIPYEVAEAYYNVCDIKKAIDYYQRALKLDADFARAYNHLGYCYSHLGQHDKALNCFRTYLELDSTANAYDSFGDGLLAAGKLDSAEWAKKKGIEIDPELSYLYWSLIYINLRQGKLKDAEKNIMNYRNYVFDDVSQARAEYFEGLIDYYKGNYSSALVHCERGLSIFSTEDIVTRNHELHWLHAVINVKLGRISTAKDMLSQMKRIISENDINITNYRMGILKYMYHLKALIYAAEENYQQIVSIIGLFDGGLKHKIKDHGNPFDLSFFYTEFADIFLSTTNPNVNYAKGLLEKALLYNPNYPFALYKLRKIHENENNIEQVHTLNERLNVVWSNADEYFVTHLAF
jgi:tetratricopeptide (TPR) repeat protein